MPKYLGHPFYFCITNNPSQLDNGEKPQKAKVFNKTNHKLTKSELISWANRNKYR